MIRFAEMMLISVELNLQDVMVPPLLADLMKKDGETTIDGTTLARSNGKKLKIYACEYSYETMDLLIWNNKIHQMFKIRLYIEVSSYDLITRFEYHPISVSHPYTPTHFSL